MTTSQPGNREARRKAAKKTKEDRPTTAAEFKKKSGNSLLELPSGNRVKIRRPGMIKLLESGFLPDPLAQLVQNEIKNRTGKVQESDLIKAVAGGGDMELIKEMMRTTDRVAAFCVIEPEVRWHEREVIPRFNSASVDTTYEDIPEDERDSDVVYTDEMEMDDKTFIFQAAVGGSTDLTRFREATSALVGDLSAG